MSAIERAQRDEAAGDLASAHQRLRSRIGSLGYDAGVCERLARLSVRMGDPAEAGRWYFLCESADAEAGPCIERFRARYVPRQLIMELPRAVREGPWDRFPPLVAVRMSELGRPPRKNLPSAAGWDWSDRFMLIGCGVIALVLIAAVVVGLRTLIGWAFGR